MADTNLYAVGYDVGFEDGFKEAQGRVKELEDDNKGLRHMILDQINSTGDDPEIMAASRAEWAARAKAAEARIEELQAENARLEAQMALVAPFLEALEAVQRTLTGGNDD